MTHKIDTEQPKDIKVKQMKAEDIVRKCNEFVAGLQKESSTFSAPPEIDLTPTYSGGISTGYHITLRFLVGINEQPKDIK